jgi:hypothetical protein
VGEVGPPSQTKPKKSKVSTNIQQKHAKQNKESGGMIEGKRRRKKSPKTSL